MIFNSERSCHLLVERILGMKGSRQLHSPQPKSFFEEIVGEMLPVEVAASRKATFTFHFDRWLNQELSSVVGQRLQDLSDDLKSSINPIVAKQLWLDFNSGRTNWARPWALYGLDAWTQHTT
jgi:hypothetical protein